MANEQKSSLTSELAHEGHTQAAGSLIAQSHHLCADHLETWRPRELDPRTKSLMLRVTWQGEMSLGSRKYRPACFLLQGSEGVPESRFRRDGLALKGQVS